MLFTSVIIFAETHDWRKKHIHLIAMPDTVKGGVYRQLCSYSAFVELRVIDKSKPIITGNLSARCWPGGDVRYREICAATDQEKFDLIYDIEKLEDIPSTSHSSLWEFYLAVGYDFRKRKWIK